MTAWPMVRLGDILDPVSRPVLVHPDREYRLLGTHWYGEGLYVKNIKTGSEIQAKSLYRVSTGDFVYNRLFAWKGSFAIASPDVDDCYVSNEFPCFRPNEQLVDAAYLKYFFSRESVWAEALGLSSGGTPTSRNRLKEQHLLAMSMPLPPIEEQRRIVERIEGFREKMESAGRIATEVELATDNMWMVLARRIFDEIPHGGPASLGEWVSLTGGGTPSKGTPEYWQGRIPWVSPKDMKTRVIRDSVDHISEAGIQGSAAKLLSPGAVLIVVRGMILTHTVPSAVLDVPATINQDMKALVPKKGLDPEFLSMRLWAFNRELLALVERSTHDTRKLETEKLLRFPVIVPPLAAQKRVCQELRRLEEQVGILSAYRQVAKREIDVLMLSVLNQAFSGRL